MAAIASAIAIVRLAISACSRSTMRPSSWIAPREAFSGSAKAAMIPMITHCILATRAHGLEILDGPYGDIGNVDGFAEDCAQGRDLGFDGKTLIHPSHIDACNAIFTPPAEEVAEARKILAAFELPENASRGAIQLDGRMVERLHAEMAKRTIEIADAIAAIARP